MGKFEDLEIWKHSHKLVLDIYNISKKFPVEERFRLADQICRASSSIPMNIAEGTGRNTDKDFAYFLTIARGSLYETKYQLLLAKDLGYIKNDEYKELVARCDIIGKQLNVFIKRLKRDS